MSTPAGAKSNKNYRFRSLSTLQLAGGGLIVVRYTRGLLVAKFMRESNCCNLLTIKATHKCGLICENQPLTQTLELIFPKLEFAGSGWF